MAKALDYGGVIGDQQLQAISDQVASVCAELNTHAGFNSISQERELFNDSEEAQEHLDRALESVIRESRNGLVKAKEAVTNFVATQWDHTSLSDLPSLLIEIYGSLNMVPLVRPAQILESCEKYVSQSLLDEKVIPEWKMLDTLADAITSIDYYLERFAEHNEQESEAILDVAAASVALLGYPLAEGVSQLINTDEALTSESLLSVEADTNAEINSESSILADEEPVVTNLEDAPILAEVIPVLSPVEINDKKGEPENNHNEAMTNEPSLMKILVLIKLLIMTRILIQKL